jgi:hypothetical protein
MDLEALEPIPSQMSSVHVPTNNFFNIHFNISSHLRLGLVNDLFPISPATKILYTP